MPFSISLSDLLHLVGLSLVASRLPQMALFHFFMAEFYSIVCTYHIFFAHSSVNECLGGFCVLVIVNSWISLVLKNDMGWKVSVRSTSFLASMSNSFLEVFIGKVRWENMSKRTAKIKALCVPQNLSTSKVRASSWLTSCSSYFSILLPAFLIHSRGWQKCGSHARSVYKIFAQQSLHLLKHIYICEWVITQPLQEGIPWNSGSQDYRNILETQPPVGPLNPFVPSLCHSLKSHCLGLYSAWTAFGLKCLSYLSLAPTFTQCPMTSGTSSPLFSLPTTSVAQLWLLEPWTGKALWVPPLHDLKHSYSVKSHSYKYVVCNSGALLLWAPCLWHLFIIFISLASWPA